MARAYISIGSNIDPERNVRSGLAALEEVFGALTVSQIYCSRPIGFDGADFYNLVAGFDTGLDPWRLQQRLRVIEDAHGRCRRNRPRFNSRTLDLDLLLYDDWVMRGDGLELPRDEITRYAFVLQPLAEIAGQRRHPLLGESFAALWRAFDADDQALHAIRLEG